MIDASSRPALRAIESIVIPDRRYGKVLLLRDTQGITDAHAIIPPELVPIVSRFTGDRTCAEIARVASKDLGSEVPVEAVVRLAEQLDEGLFLDSVRFRRARARVGREFADADVRAASHAGGAYHKDKGELEAYLDRECLAHGAKGTNGANGTSGATSPRTARATSGATRHMVALVAPHIDPWRGAVGYGRAYAALERALAPEVDTFVLFGTSHAPMREHFALCRKAFDTPLGTALADFEALDAIAGSADFDPYADQFNHKREHSLEFQVVFLKHMMKDRPFRIIPVLAGLGQHQARGTDPASDARATRFLDGIRDLVAKRGRRAVIVAGADMAHVGPRFGDRLALGASERRSLEVTDRASLDHAVSGDAPAFWADVAKDLETRRVCGLAPIYALLRSLPSAPASGASEILHYEQTIDDDDGSIVSHASLGFYG
jgi:AmmeMemoRadiSam system protein B